MKTTVCKFTDKNIKAHKDQGGQLRDENESTLYFRYNTKNKNKGVFHYRHYADGTSKYIKLGSYPALNVALAKQARINMIRRISVGDSVKETQTALLNTVAELSVWYLKKQQEDVFQVKNNYKNVKSIFRLHIIGLIGDVKIKDLTINLLDIDFYRKMSASGLALGTIELVIIKLKSALKSALAMGLIKKNPVPTLALIRFTNVKTVPKPCKLEDNGLATVVDVIAKGSDESRMMVYMLALFAVRIGELSGASWSEFDLEQGKWIIPASRTKTKQKKHTLFIPKLFVDLLRRYKRTQLNNKRNSLFLFPQRINKRKHISGNSGCRRISKLFKRKVTAHDFRKNASTWWAENNTDYIIVKFLLNHTLTGLDKTYITTHADEQCLSATAKRFDFLRSQGFFTELYEIRGLRLVA